MTRNRLALTKLFSNSTGTVYVAGSFEALQITEAVAKELPIGSMQILLDPNPKVLYKETDFETLANITYIYN
jgi:hypothetical protein